MLPLSKRALKDQLSCQIIDKIFNKTTHKCQCEVPSSESSEMSIGQITEDETDHDETGYEEDYNDVDQSSNSVKFDLSTPNLTDTDASDLWSDM